MGDTDSRTFSASPQTAAAMTPATNDQTKKQGGATGQAALPVMDPCKPADADAGRLDQGLLAAHTKDTKHLEFYGKNIPNKRNTKTDKIYKNLHETFGSVDEAVRQQHALLGLSCRNTGVVHHTSAMKEEEFVKEEFIEEDFIKEEFIKEEKD